MEPTINPEQKQNPPKGLSEGQVASEAPKPEPSGVDLLKIIVNNLREIVGLEKKQTTTNLDVLTDYPFVSGVKTIASVTTSEEAYPNFENIYTSLGYGATSGEVLNLGPGNIFLVISQTPAAPAAQEIKIQPGQRFTWGTGPRARIIRYVYLRTSVAGTAYQLHAG